MHFSIIISLNYYVLEGKKNKHCTRLNDEILKPVEKAKQI